MDSGEGFSIAVEQDGSGSVVRIMGELDIATAPQLRDCLADLDGATVTLDFSSITFMDSGGIAVLAWAMKRARHGGAELHIRGVHRRRCGCSRSREWIAELNFDGEGPARIGQPNASDRTIRQQIRSLHDQIDRRNARGDALMCACPLRSQREAVPIPVMGNREPTVCPQFTSHVRARWRTSARPPG